MNFSLRVLCCLFFISCSTPFTSGKSEVETLYNKAIAQKKERSYLLAIDTFNELKTKYSYSSYAKKAELALADIEFERKQFAQASALYRIYRDTHPKDKRIPYVLLQIGESFRLQGKEGHDRDLAGVLNAVIYYQEVLNDYPESEEAEIAEKKLEESTQRLKDKQLYQADFYYRFKKFQSARYRYLDILKRYDDDSTLKMAMERIAQSSFELKEFSKCMDYTELYIKQFELNKWDTTLIKNIDENCQKAHTKQEAVTVGESA